MALAIHFIFTGKSLNMANSFSALSGIFKVLGVFIFNILLSAFVVLVFWARL
ncbi:hypothetical protein ABID22_001293 [Pontibacter aydingkolensis]